MHSYETDGGEFVQWLFGWEPDDDEVAIVMQEPVPVILAHTCGLTFTVPARVSEDEVCSTLSTLIQGLSSLGMIGGALHARGWELVEAWSNAPNRRRHLMDHRIHRDWVGETTDESARRWFKELIRTRDPVLGA